MPQALPVMADLIGHLFSALLHGDPWTCLFFRLRAVNRPFFLIFLHGDAYSAPFFRLRAGDGTGRA